MPVTAFADELAGDQQQMTVEAVAADAAEVANAAQTLTAPAVPADLQDQVAAASALEAKEPVEAFEAANAEMVVESSPATGDSASDTVADDATEIEGVTTVTDGAAEDETATVANGAADDDAAADASIVGGASADPTVSDVVTEETEATTDAADLLAPTDDEAEDADVDAEYETGWNNIDGKWYWYDEGASEAKTGWLVTDQAIPGGTSEGLQRYWLGEEDAGGSVVTNLFEAIIDGVSSWFYGTDEGYVVRGKYVDPETGNIYLADNEGRLAGGAEGGWYVSDEYGDGLQRYWIDPESHAAKAGYSTDGWAHYTTDDGYVVRGKVSYEADGKTYVLIADNEGELAGGEEGGWVVSDKYGDGLQRYWIDPLSHAAVVGYSTDGWAHYTTPMGYVVRGKFDTGRGMVYLADQDGLLTDAAGWLVTDEYDGVLERYWIDETTHAARSGFFTVDGAQYFGVGGQGYVLRGAIPWGDVMLLADNDGKLVGSAGSGTGAVKNGVTFQGGWLDSSLYVGGNQRYFIVAVPGQSGFFGALIGEFAIGDSKYYGRDDFGYIVRGGSYTNPSGMVYYADENGVLDEYGWLTDVGRRVWDQIMYKTSGTQYLLAVDRINCRTVVFQGSAGNWRPIFDWSCTTGNPIYNGGDGTLKGDWQIGGPDWAYADHTWSPGDPFPTNRDNYRVANWVKSGALYFTGFFYNLGFHSTVINYNDESQLGHRISHGCVRLLEPNAKWIYDNCAIGTRVCVL